MAKKISKDINSQFMPTYINGIPTYMCGGKLRYDLGGMMVPGGMLDMSQYTTQSPALSTGLTQGVSAVGQGMEQITNAYRPNKANYGTNIGGGALKGAATGAALGSVVPGIGTVVGGAVGAIGGALSGLTKSIARSGQIKQEEEKAQQQQQDMMKQQLISNLPAQSSYVPTFANGGKVNNRNIGQVADNFYDTQSIYTKALANKYPNIPIKDILSKSAQDSTFSNRNLDQYANNLISTYGDFHLKPNEMDSVRNMAGSDIRNIQDSIAGYDPKDVMLQGSKEQNDLNYKFGPRMMLQRLYKKGQSPYKALDEFANGGEITDRVTSFENGGLHSENGGIPIGQNAMVERDEYMYTNKQGKKYIFSNKF